MTVIPLRAGRQQQIPILAAGPLGGRGRVGRQPTDGGAVNFPQADLGPTWPTSVGRAFPGKLTAFRLASGWRVIQEGPRHEHLKTSQLHREWRGPFPLRALFSVYARR